MKQQIRVPPANPNGTITTFRAILKKESRPLPNCSKLAGQINFEKLCSPEDGCCESVRSSSSFCWNMYENVLGIDARAVCRNCCPETKLLGQPKRKRDNLPQTITCSSLSIYGDIQRHCSTCCTDQNNSNDQQCTRIREALSANEWSQSCVSCTTL